MRQFRTSLLLSLILACGPALGDSLQFRVLSESGQPVHSAVLTAGDPEDKLVMSEAEMDQIDREFSPYVIAIQEGQKVAFPNKDSVRHHVYSFSPAKQFEMRLYSGRPEAPLAFEKSGAVVLGCNIHDNMVGYIYVTRRPYRSVTNSIGEARLTATTDIQEIVLWHPNLSLDSQAELTLSLKDLRTVTEDGLTYYLVNLDIPTPPENPQEIASPSDRFSRFKIE